jgi:hypothetical protein
MQMHPFDHDDALAMRDLTIPKGAGLDRAVLNDMRVPLVAVMDLAKPGIILDHPAEASIAQVFLRGRSIGEIRRLAGSVPARRLSHSLV